MRCIDTEFSKARNETRQIMNLNRWAVCDAFRSCSETSSGRRRHYWRKKENKWSKKEHRKKFFTHSKASIRYTIIEWLKSLTNLKTKLENNLWWTYAKHRTASLCRIIAASDIRVVWHRMITPTWTISLTHSSKDSTKEFNLLEQLGLAAVPDIIHRNRVQ